MTVPDIVVDPDTPILLLMDTDPVKVVDVDTTPDKLVDPVTTMLLLPSTPSSEDPEYAAVVGVSENPYHAVFKYASITITYTSYFVPIVRDDWLAVPSTLYRTDVCVLGMPKGVLPG